MKLLAPDLFVRSHLRFNTNHFGLFTWRTDAPPPVNGSMWRKLLRAEEVEHLQKETTRSRGCISEHTPVLPLRPPPPQPAYTSAGAGRCLGPNFKASTLLQTRIRENPRCFLWTSSRASGDWASDLLDTRGTRGTRGTLTFKHLTSNTVVDTERDRNVTADVCSTSPTPKYIKFHFVESNSSVKKSHIKFFV